MRASDRHPVFLDRLRVLAAEREDKIANAEAVKEWSIQSAQQLCEYQRFAAARIFEVRFTPVLCLPPCLCVRDCAWPDRTSVAC
jgi:hypothetical protein